jgi:hypothetical protein
MGDTGKDNDKSKGNILSLGFAFAPVFGRVDGPLRGGFRGQAEGLAYLDVRAGTAATATATATADTGLFTALLILRLK